MHTLLVARVLHPYGHVVQARGAAAGRRRQVEGRQAGLLMLLRGCHLSLIQVVHTNNKAALPQCGTTGPIWCSTLTQMWAFLLLEGSVRVCVRCSFLAF